jgi:ferritin-like metal-binding protein YciE
MRSIQTDLPRMQYEVHRTDRPFHVRFQERFRDYKYVNIKSKFSQHLLDNKHSIGPIENITDIIHTTIKGRLLDTIERLFYIYNETRRNNQIKDKCAAKPNVMFDTVILEDTDRAHFTS